MKRLPFFIYRPEEWIFIINFATKNNIKFLYNEDY